MTSGSHSLEANDTVEFINSINSLFDLLNSTPKAVKAQTEFIGDSENTHEPK